MKNDHRTSKPGLPELSFRDFLITENEVKVLKHRIRVSPIEHDRFEKKQKFKSKKISPFLMLLF
jgi:hypothetical protein